jgi:hypothetical protein
VSAVPDIYNDSFIVHCRLLGEGWDPKDGWIDSAMFVDPSASEIRIYQDVNRGSRIGNGSKKTNWVVQAHLVDDEKLQYNKMYETIRTVCLALEIGDDDITESVTFKEFKSLPKGKKTNRQVGSTELSYYDEVGADFFAKSFSVYIKEGRYHKFGQTVNDILRDSIQLDKDLYGYLDDQAHKVNKEIFKKYSKDFFCNYSKGQWSGILNRIKKGEHFLLSEENINCAINWQIDRGTLRLQTLSQIKDEFKTRLEICAFIGPSEIGLASTELSKKYNYSRRTINNMRKEFDLAKAQRKNQKQVIDLYKNNYKNFSYLEELDKWVHVESNKLGVKISLHQCIGHGKWNGIRKKYCPELTEYFNKLKADGKAGMKHLHTAAAKTVRTPIGTFNGVATACKELNISGTILRKLFNTNPTQYYIIK